jgi:membrane protein
VAVIAWVAASVGFSVYLANFADYGATYGSLGAAIGPPFYLNITASIVLFGAEVNAAIRRQVMER